VHAFSDLKEEIEGTFVLSRHLSSIPSEAKKSRPLLECNLVVIHLELGVIQIAFKRESEEWE